MSDEHLPEVDHPCLLLSGLDSLYAGLFVDGLGLDWDLLETAKQEAQADRQRVREIRLGAETFAVEPRGAHPYRYVLSNEDFRIRLSEAISPRCHVQYRSKGLWSHGHHALTDRLHALFAALNCRELRPPSVSRADFAFDFAVDLIGVVSDNFVTRAVKDATWRENGRPQSFQIGTGDTVVRVYDKVAEIEQASDKYWFYDLWGQRESVWRVEAQLRRERLKAGDIETLSDLDDLSADCLREVFSKHTRLCVPNDDANRARWPLHPLWQSLQTALSAMPQQGLIESIQPVSGLEYALARKLQSVTGMLKSYIADWAVFRGMDAPPDLEAALATLGIALDQQVSPTLWEVDVFDKMQRRRLGQ